MIYWSFVVLVVAEAQSLVVRFYRKFFSVYEPYNRNCSINITIWLLLLRRLYLKLSFGDKANHF